MRRFTGQRIFCVPALLVLTLGGSAHLSVEKTPRPRVKAADAESTPVAKVARAKKMIASWYGDTFQGRKTSSGELFDKAKLTAAHKTLPLGSLLRLTVVRTGRSVVVRINDRGPWIKNRDLDISEAAAVQLGIRDRGIAAVEAMLVK